MDYANDHALATAVAGLMGYSKLATFSAQAANATAAPDLISRLGLSNRSMVQLQRVNALVALLREWGEEPTQIMAAFQPVLDAFRAGAPAADWWEAVVQTYIGHGVASDLEHELVAGLPPTYREALTPHLARGASAEYVASVVAAAVAVDERWSHRLSLWGRRVVGEALSVVNQVFQVHPELAELLDSSGPGDPLAALRGRLTQAHARRMTDLGLTF